MATVKEQFGATTALTITLNNLTTATGFAISNQVDNTTDLFLDVLIEILIADVVEAGNKQILVYAIDSVDGTNWSFGNTAADALANPGALAFVGALPLNGTGPWRSRAMSLAAAFGGNVPPYWKLAVMNDAGVTLAASNNSVQYRGVLAQSV